MGHRLGKARASPGSNGNYSLRFKENNASFPQSEEFPPALFSVFVFQKGIPSQEGGDRSQPGSQVGSRLFWSSLWALTQKCRGSLQHPHCLLTPTVAITEEEIEERQIKRPWPSRPMVCGTGLFKCFCGVCWFFISPTTWLLQNGQEALA